MSDIIKALPADAGCWIDGHWGRYGLTRLIDIAVSHGFVLHEVEEEACAAYEDGQERIGGIEYLFEFIVDQADVCEEWLNEHVAPEGYSFGWHDGEFFLWSDADWQETC